MDILENVSRETQECLENFQTLLLKWNGKINLVSRPSEVDLWNRHIMDSAQLWRFRPNRNVRWADLGSGGGFPGMVLAILAQNDPAGVQLTLVESDARKCAFLLAAKTGLKIDVEIVNKRIEDTEPLRADIISARALAPLTTLLGWAEKHLGNDGICLFPKGETVHNEIEAARQFWSFTYVLHPSETSPTSAILEIGAIKRV